MPFSRKRTIVLVLALFCTAAGAAPVPAPDMDEEARMVLNLQASVARSFVLDKDLKLDPALRSAGETMSTAHMARVDTLLRAWMKEERSARPGIKSGHLHTAVWARLQNELALWQVEPGDEAYERATLAVLKTAPRVCLVTGNYRTSDFASRLLRIQAMPAAQRDAALQTERRLLERWGQARTAPPWPDPLPRDAAAAALKRWQAGGPHPAQALSPMLTKIVSGQPGDYRSLHLMDRCVVQQWWLQESLRQGAAPAAVLNAFRFGTLIGPSERFADSTWTPPQDLKVEASATRPAYPKLAAYFFVTGRTRVRATLDAGGKPVDASIVGRDIEVAGIRGVRPLAFETLFDPQTLSYALGQQYKPGAPDTMELVWALDDTPGARP